MQPNRFRVKATEIAVGDLRLHSSANREVRPNRVRFFQANMDPNALGRFAVWRDGHNFYVIDGQHRKLALEALDLQGYKVRCDVYEGASFPEACELFLKLNDGLTVSPFDKFDKGVKAGRMAEVETLRIISDAGFRIGSQVGEGRIVATAAALDTWKLDQGDALRITLATLTQAWGHTATAVEGPMIRGMGLVASAYNGEADYAALAKKLSKFPGGPGNLLGQAKALRDYQGGTIPRNVARMIITLYNKGRRSGQLQPL